MTFIMPDMRTESLNLFLDKFNKYPGERNVVIVMDNASSHKSKSLKLFSSEKLKNLTFYPYIKEAISG